MSRTGAADHPASAVVSAARHAAGRLDIRHIVVAGRDDHPTAANGVHNVARRLVREQCAAGHDARLILLSYHPLQAPRAGEDPLQILPLAGRSVRGRVVQLRREIAELVLADADASTVFHIHGGREPLLIGLANRMHDRGLPYAVTVHGRFSHVYDGTGACLSRPTALYLRLMERGLLTRARFVHALSSAEKQVVRRIAPQARIEVVGNGAYSSRLGPVPARRAVRARSAEFPHFMFCGRYAVHHKGLDLMLQGFALYRRSGGRGHLTTIGSGPARATLQDMAAGLGIADAVTVHGPLFAEARDQMLHGGDYFVMSSRYEGVPLAGLEAALLGLPLVVTNETGLADAAAAYGAGFPIAALSPEAVCAAFQQAAAQGADDWAAQCASAYRLAVSIGDWTGISASLCNLYRSSPQVE